MLTVLPAASADEDVAAVMHQYDLDRSGDLNWDEFRPLAQDGALMCAVMHLPKACCYPVRAM